MSRFNNFVVVGVFALVALASQSARAVNVVSNGSFENGPTGLGVTPDDWTLFSGPNYDVIPNSTSNHATDGNNWLQISTTTAGQFPILFQVTPHIIQDGWTYEVLANARNFDGGGVYRTVLLSTPDPNTIATSSNMLVLLHDTGPDGSVDPMPEYSGSVVAGGVHVGRYLAISVSSFDAPGTRGWDNIRVNAVPEPASFVIIGFGTACCLLSVWRRRRR